MATTVVNKKTDDYDIYIGRPGLLGNPYIIGKDGTREECIEKYRKLFYSSGTHKSYAKRCCKDKRLGCFCKPLPCHGDVIADFLNGKEENEKRTTLNTNI